MNEKKICHVCKKEKKPYIKFMDSNIISFMEHDRAREKGEICERCDNYFAMTGEFKDATEEEYKLVQKASRFANAMHKWWTKDEPLDIDGHDGDSRKWEGIVMIAQWYRDQFGTPKSGKEKQ